MNRCAPFNVTVEIALRDGPSGGERRFRLGRELSLPPRIAFQGTLPVVGAGRGEISFQMPGGGPWVRSLARLRFDPEQPELGATADLVDPAPETVQVLEAYIERCATTKRTTL